MIKKGSLALGLAFCLAFIISVQPASAQFGWPRMNLDSLNALTAADYADMLDQLGLSASDVRPGRDGNSPDPSRLPNYDEFKANPYPFYPDPLTTFAGEPVKDARTWYRVRRPEIVRAFEDEVYGRIPEGVPSVTWKVVSEEKVTLGDTPCLHRRLLGVADNSAYPAISVEMQAEILWPENAAGQLPVVMEFGFGFYFGNMPGMPASADKPWYQQVVERGWAAANISPNSIQADGGHGLRNGIIGLTNHGAPRKPTDWGSLRAWGWGSSRLLDYLESEPLFDATKVAIEGVSRYGKAAIVAMAFDERFAAGFIASSGKGGVAPWRRDCGESTGNLAGSGEYHWMCGNFIKYGAEPLTDADFPVDQHELIALCAPRPCLISAGTPERDQWQDIIGMFMAAAKASPVYELLGVRGIGTDVFPGVDVGLMDGRVAYREHHGGHEAGPNWPYFLDYFDREVVSSYSNPVIAENCPDPTVLDNRERDGWFYLYSTARRISEGVNDIPIYRSKNLVSWELCGTAFYPGKKPDWEPKGSLWAPAINYIDGKYVLYYAEGVWGDHDRSASGVAVSDSPTGPFVIAG